MSKIDPAYMARISAGTASGIDYKSLLNPEQYEAVTTTEGPVLIVAGAGTGKTNTLIKRVMYLIDVKKVLPEQILLLTFTNKAAQEMIYRAKSTLDDRCSKVVACTYHSFCAAILRKYAKYLGMDNNYVLYSPEEVADAFGLIREKEGISREKDLPGNKSLASILSASVNKSVSIKYIIENAYPDYVQEIETIERLTELYIKYKRKKNAIDYDDLITLTNRLLEENPITIAKRISDTYKYIMVDEYQDSNLEQFKLLSNLRQFENKNICVVGDDFQSIYGFRGANFKNIMDFPKQFTPCKVIKLIRNYRSNQEILDLSNAIMKQARNKYEKELVGLSHADHKPYLVMTDNQDSEASAIKQAIEAYHQEGMAYKDMAVIIHSSNNSLKLEAMIASSIPYKKFGGIRFIDRVFVKDIFAFLKLVSNKADELSWYRILQLLPGIGSAGAKKITEAIPEHGIDELIVESHFKKKSAPYLTKLHSYFNEMEDMDFHEQINHIINDYYPAIMKDSIMSKKVVDKTREEDTLKQRLNDLDEHIQQARILIDIAKGYKTASQFICEMMIEAYDFDKTEDDFLTITTVHSVKGLEFKVVFVMDCIDGVFPWERKPKAFTEEAIKESIEGMEEERRVFYVAITRAKEDLYMFFPELSGYGDKMYRTDISRFLEGLEDTYCDVEDYRS